MAKKNFIESFKEGASVLNKMGIQPKLFDLDEDETTMVNSNEGLKTIRQAMFDKLITKATTPEEVDKSVEVASETQKDVDANQNLLNAVGEKAKVLGDKLGFNKYSQRQPYLTKDDIPIETFLNYSPEEKNRMSNEYLNAINDRKINAKEPAIEKLGVEDYFPDISKDIAVGRISSSMLGDRTRYVAQGGLIPWGVVDARKRALEADAAEKAKKADELKMKRFATSEQFQTRYDEDYFDKINEYLDMAGNDTSLLMDPSTELGKEFMKFQVRTENLYKENKYVDSIADSVFEAQSKGKYVPDHTLNLLNQWQDGAINVDDYLSGKKNISEISDQLKAYDNSIKWADDKLKDLKDQIDIRPINPDSLDNPEYAKNAMDALKFKSNMSYDQYITAVSKYWDASRLKTVVDGAFTQNNFYKGQSSEEEGKLKATLTDYMLNSLKSEVSLEQKTVDNKKLDWAKYNREGQWREEDKKTFYDQVRETAETDLQPVYDQIRADVMNNPNIPKDQKIKQIMYRINATNAKKGLKPMVASNGQNILSHAAFEIPMLDNVKGTEISATPDQAMFMATKRINGKDYKVKKTVSEVVNDMDSYNLTKEEKTELLRIYKTGSITIKAKTQYGYNAVWEGNGYTPIEYATGDTSNKRKSNIVGTSGKVTFNVAAESKTTKEGKESTTMTLPGESESLFDYIIETDNSNPIGTSKLNTGFNAKPATEALNTDLKK